MPRPVFRVQRSAGDQFEDRPADIDHPYDNFQETLYEHRGPVTCVEKNFKDQTVFASAGKDSKVFLWSLTGTEDAEFISEIGKNQLYKHGGSSLNMGHVTSIKWYDENVLALSMSNGTIQFNDIRIKQGTAEDSVCSACSLITKVEGAIWDTALWNSPSGVMLVAAEDSGRVTLIDPRMTT